MVLNACRSGAMGKRLEAGVATALLHAGVPSVVAMAYSVYAFAAADFMAEICASLVREDRLREAMLAGRRELAVRPDRLCEGGSRPLQDWVVPVHYRRRDVSFPRLTAAPPGARAPVRRAPAGGPEAPGTAGWDADFLTRPAKGAWAQLQRKDGPPVAR
jgi:CHAT domain